MISFVLGVGGDHHAGDLAPNATGRHQAAAHSTHAPPPLMFCHPARDSSLNVRDNASSAAPVRASGAGAAGWGPSGVPGVPGSRAMARTVRRGLGLLYDPKRAAPRSEHVSMRPGLDQLDGRRLAAMSERRYHGAEELGLVGAALEGDRSIFQQDHLRPRCPWCSIRLRPRRVLWGWDPGSRRRTHHCLNCEGSWAVVEDPGVLVQALMSYWLARQAGEGIEPYLTFAARRVDELHLKVLVA